MRPNSRKVLNIFLVCVFLVMYFGALSSVSLTDPDEVFYAMTAQEMLDSGSVLTPVIFDQPQFEKPPLFYWALEVSFKVFGVHPLSARIIPVLCGLIGLVCTFFFCRRVFNERIAYLSVIMLGTSALYLALSKAVLTDIMLAVFMAMAFYAFYLWFLEAKDSWLFGFALASSLAVLTKGPVAIIILFLACVVFLSVFREFKRLKDFFLHPWILVFLLLSVPWYAVMIAKFGSTFTDEFFIRDNLDRILYAEHKNFDHWYFYPMIMVAGLFPWMFYLVVMGRGWKEHSRACLFLLVWVALTFIVFQRAHSKLASYILPMIPAWVMLLSVSVNELTKRCRRVSILSILYGVLGVVILVAPLVLMRRYHDYIWPQAVVALVVLAFAFLTCAVFLWKGEVFKAVLIKSVGMALMVAVVGINVPDAIEREVANEYLTRIVKDQGYENQPIIVGKLYSRGVHFFTGSPVVVWDENPQPFWSPHPIDVITDKEIEDYVNAKPRVLCVIKYSSWENFKRIFQDRRINRLIAQDGKKVVVVSDRI